MFAPPDLALDALHRGAEALLRHPGVRRRARTRLARETAVLWRRYLRRLAGAAPPGIVRPEAHDRRFADPAWRRHPLFAFLAELHVVLRRRAAGLVAALPGLDPLPRRRLAFLVGRHVEALSPANAPWTNPVVLQAALASNGRSLRRGVVRLGRDAARGPPVMPRPAVLRPGRDVATTPGAVVAENDLMQLIHYAPTTREVGAVPLLMVPSWINKFYVLDLRPQNSLVRWALDRGVQVFMVSWVNPDARHAERGLGDYLEAGPAAAAEAVRRRTGQDGVHLLGYCLGGTLIACYAAREAALGRFDVRSLTLLATLLDFAEPGDLGLFLDERSVAAIERRMQRQGYLPAEALGGVFAGLRANDLIWPALVDGYLLGKAPRRFDLAAWNADATRLPYRLHSQCLRHLYLDNRLARPGGLCLNGVPIDLGLIEAPAFVLGTRDDHIAPWPSAYRGLRLLNSSPRRFALGGSGHVAGVVNPPSSGKHGHALAEADGHDPIAWQRTARHEPGSWWPAWHDWLKGLDPTMVPARPLADGIEPAPGRYVRG